MMEEDSESTIIDTNKDCQESQEKLEKKTSRAQLLLPLSFKCLRLAACSIENGCPLSHGWNLTKWRSLKRRKPVCFGVQGPVSACHFNGHWSKVRMVAMGYEHCLIVTADSLLGAPGKPASRAEGTSNP